MFRRPHHQRIAAVLRAFNADLLAQSECYFGGGTAIVLSLGEYRESVDIDFLCSSKDGFNLLRNLVSHDLGPLLKTPIKHLRQVRIERDKISTFLEIDAKPIKVEFIQEGNAGVDGAVDPAFGIPTLSRLDMFTQKLLANADRGADKAFMSRDIIDLAMMMQQWGVIPLQAWEKAYGAYGPYLIKGFENSIKLTLDTHYFAGCLRTMGMDPAQLSRIERLLLTAQDALPDVAQSVQIAAKQPRP